MFALCDIAIDCIVCMFVYICVTIVDVHKGPLMEINPILFYYILFYSCKYEEYPIKNEGARVVTTLYINILDAKGR